MPALFAAITAAMGSTTTHPRHHHQSRYCCRLMALSQVDQQNGRVRELERHLSEANAMIDNLRFPNLHTYYFSGILQMLFVEPDSGLPLQEQVTRALVERLQTRPQPVRLLLFADGLVPCEVFIFTSQD